MHSSAADILLNVHAARAVVQDFCPLADSIEWRIGQSYLQERGNKAFLRDPEPVPFAINNDGNLSVRSAQTLFAALDAADQAGTLDPDIFVLELGIGIGLFARFFLDAFRRLSREHGKDYYDRLCYVAGDYSAPMLRDAGRHGVFADHAGRYVLRVVDALQPDRSLAGDPWFREANGKPFRAVFLNYLLDCLPAAVLRVEGEAVTQLHVRSCIARSADLRGYTDLTPEELGRLADAPEPVFGALRRVASLLASEYAYRPVNPRDVPLGEFAVQFARSTGQGLVVHNYGAVQALERLLGLLNDTGFILVNDYGQVRVGGADDFQHQRYSQSTFVGVSFPLLKSYFAGKDSVLWVEPVEADDASIHARLLGRKPWPEAVACFQDRFDKAALEAAQGAVRRARDLVQAGRFEAALTAYRQALEGQPYNWLLMNEVSHFLTFPLRAPAAGLEMARAALACNPACSADLWNMLGDSLFELGRVEESRQAFLRALQINPDDARARFNLTFVHVRTEEYADAMRRIAEALTLDRTGTYRDRLLQTQSEILARLSQRYQQEHRRMADRISTRLDTPKPSGTPEDANSKAGVNQGRGNPTPMTGGRPVPGATG
jgi:tetratricopeptide (TPR) repeat protein